MCPSFCLVSWDGRLGNLLIPDHCLLFYLTFQILFSGKNKKNISTCHLRFLASMLNVNRDYYLLNGDFVTLTENFIVPLTLSAGCRLLKSSDSETGLQHRNIQLLLFSFSVPVEILNHHTFMF